jgi:hypothetical protein
VEKFSLVFLARSGSGDFVWRCRVAELGAGKCRKRAEKMTKLIEMGCRQET